MTTPGRDVGELLPADLLFFSDRTIAASRTSASRSASGGWCISRSAAAATRWSSSTIGGTRTSIGCASDFCMAQDGWCVRQLIIVPAGICVAVRTWTPTSIVWSPSIAIAIV